MGEVFEAEDLLLGRHVALKFLPDALAHDPLVLERCKREARAASFLDHSNICTIFEIGEHEDHTYIAMQSLEGQTLRDRTCGLDLILDFGIRIADALDTAHAKGIVHRDIKPQIFLLPFAVRPSSWTSAWRKSPVLPAVCARHQLPGNLRSRRLAPLILPGQELRSTLLDGIKLSVIEFWLRPVHSLVASAE